MKQKECAVLYIAGQSNAHAHNQKRKEEDIRKEGFSHVFTLNRAENQSFDTDHVVWSPFTSFGGNLGETQDATYSMGSFLAEKWQAAIHAGVDLPDLYLVQISIGAQGILNGMWNPDFERQLIPGVLGEVRISLFPLALHVFDLVHKDLSARFETVHALGLHWIGSESDTEGDWYRHPEFSDRYRLFFEQMRSAIGFRCPLVLYRLLYYKLRAREHREAVGLDVINAEWERLEKTFPDCMVRDLSQSDVFRPERENDGIFDDDGIHYNRFAQEWFADQVMKDVLTSTDWRRKS